MKWLKTRTYRACHELARRLRVDPEGIVTILRHGSANFYDVWQQPKRGGGYRTIMSPQEPLATIQERLLYLLYRVPVSEIAHGYVRQRDLMTNALPHRHARSLFCLDLADAFGSVDFGSRFYYRPSYPNPWPNLEFGVSLRELMVMAQLIDVWRDDERSLAQGAPTSGYAFNLICRRMDRELQQLATNVGGTVTRWADNISFSMSHDEVDQKLRRAIWRIVEQHDFRINRRKTVHLTYANQNARPLRLPGVNIIDGQPRLTPQELKRQRMRLYCAGKQGDEATRNGVRGRAFQVYWGYLPPQLEGVYEKAAGSVDPATE